LDRIKKLFDFIEDTLSYFVTKVEEADRDRYFADRDIRSILDKTINDIILCTVDIAEECLKEKGRSIPDTYKDTILACHEFLGDIVLKIAPLVKHRNEAIHQYLRVNPVRNLSGSLNPAGIILESNPATEQWDIISNGVNWQNIVTVKSKLPDIEGDFLKSREISDYTD